MSTGIPAQACGYDAQASAPYAVEGIAPPTTGCIVARGCEGKGGVPGVTGIVRLQMSSISRSEQRANSGAVAAPDASAPCALACVRIAAAQSVSDAKSA
jgi:hypothetical protein